MELDKIPTPVWLGGGALLAFMLMRASGGNSASVKTLGPIDSGNDQTALAEIQNKGQSFNTLVNAITSLDMEEARLSAGITMEQIRGATLFDISKLSADADAMKTRLQAEAVRQASADNLAAQRSAQKAETGRSVLGQIINGAVTVLGWVFGQHSNPQPTPTAGHF